MPAHSAASPIYTALARLANFNRSRRALLASRKTSSRSSAKAKPFLFLLLILVVVTAVFLFPPAIMSSSSSSSSSAAAAASVPFQSPRKVVKKVLSLSQSEGQGATVRRSIGGHELRNLDPFLLLDEFSVSKPAGFPDHPHRGFETVTYMLDGAFTHQDFSGHKGTIRTGDVQWMTAGRGIVHSEMPAADGVQKGLQLWINLASKDKMIEPGYQELESKDISQAEKDGVAVRIIAGEAFGVRSPVYTRTPTMYMDFTMQPAKPAMDDPGSEIEYEIPAVVRVHKSGRVVRLNGTDTVPPSPCGDPANGVSSKDVVLDPAANISARLYLPAAVAAKPGKKLPVVVFFHGGAFMIHTTASPLYHKNAASLAAAAPAVVVSVDYRLAPEHPVPAAYEDAFAALKAVVSSCRPGGAEPWLAAHGDASRVVLAGDSAGANMAHRTAVRLRKERIEGYGDKVSGIALLHTYFWGKEPVGGEPTDAALRGGIDQVWHVACGGKLGLDHPYINPAASPEDLSQLGCVRVLVATAEHCWFVERSRAYAAGVKSGWGGELEFYETKGEGHVYFLLKPDCENAAKELAVVADFVRRC